MMYRVEYTIRKGALVIDVEAENKRESEEKAGEEIDTVFTARKTYCEVWKYELWGIQPR